MAASLAMTGLFLAGWFGRRNADPSNLAGFTRPVLRRLFYKVCTYITLGQFALVPLLLFTLPEAGITTRLYLIIFSGAAVGLLTVFVLLGELRRDDSHIGSRYWLVVALFSVVVLGMGSGRHVYGRQRWPRTKRTSRSTPPDIRPRWLTSTDAPPVALFLRSRVPSSSS